jgi:uncharacterized RDD family membrane protein YckC
LSERARADDYHELSAVGDRRYAGFFLRAVASVIDDVIVMTVSFALTFGALYVLYAIFHPGPSFGESFSGGLIQTVNVLAVLFTGIPYYIGFHWRYGATPGKRMLRIRVVRELDDGSLSLGRSAARYFAQALSTLPFGAGYLMAAFDPKRRALHDRIAGTVSVLVD